MSNTSWLGVLQSITQENIKGLKMADMVTGTVVSSSPISVQPDITMPPIPSAALILTSAVKPKTATVQGGSGGTVVINEGLVSGDKVLMLRVSGGQRYIVLSKI